MSFLCNATRFNVRCHICDVGTHSLSPAVWCPPGRRQGQKAASSVEIGLFLPLLGPFSSDFRNPVPASGHVCDLADFGESARPARTFSRLHRLRADPFAGARGAAWRQPVRSSRRPARPASVRCQESGTDRRRLGLPLASGAAPGPRARLRLARHSGSRPRRGRGPVLRRARY